VKYAFLLASLALIAIPCALCQQKHSPDAGLKVAAAVAPDWPDDQLVVGKSEVHVTVTVDGGYGNVINAQSKEPSSKFSEPSMSAAKLWKFFPSKPNAKQTLTFVFEVFSKNDRTRKSSTTFIPPYKVVIERSEK